MFFDSKKHDLEPTQKLFQKDLRREQLHLEDKLSKSVSNGPVWACNKQAALIVINEAIKALGLQSDLKQMLTTNPRS